MFEKLFSLLLHAKGGALATVLVLGASGALVTATVQSGVTTITITQPSTTTDGSTATTPSDSKTTTTTTNPVILALFNQTKAEDDPSAPATGDNCSDEAHAMVAQIKLVNDGFKKDHQAAQALSKDAPKTDAAKKLVKDANQALDETRKAALKAIHATLSPSVTCNNNDKDDADKDEAKDNEDDDNGSTTGTTTGTTSTTTTTGPSVAFSGADAKSIADLAISAMDLQVKNLKTALAALPAVAPKADTKKADTHANKGKGSSKGHNDNKGDD